MVQLGYCWASLTYLQCCKKPTTYTFCDSVVVRKAGGGGRAGGKAGALPSSLQMAVGPAPPMKQSAFRLAGMGVVLQVHTDPQSLLLSEKRVVGETICIFSWEQGRSKKTVP